MGICFFIDFENVHNSGLSNLKGLSKDDLIFIFYTASTETITLDNINQLNKSGCKYELIKVPAGSQSLDMHLISFVGYAIGLGGEKYNYIVISKDKDYDNVISFWKSKCGISIKRQAAINVSSVKNAIPNIDTSVDNQNNPVQELPQTIQAQIDSNGKTVDELPSEIVENVDINVQLPSDLKQELEDLILNSGRSQEMAVKVERVVADGIKEEMALSSIHFNLKAVTDDFHAIYELIKPLVKKHLKVVVQEKDDAVKKSPCEPSINEKVQKVLREKKYSGVIFNSVASIVCKNHKEKNARMLVYRAIVAKYGQEKGLELYRHIKPLL